ncbi:MAG: A/G-specific adenine glycosylase [Hyphomonadaceae bacterium]
MLHSPENLLTDLNKWYGRNARRLPWRVGPTERANGVQPDAYRVWLSEIMLQQTTVPHAAPYFQDFVERWPVVTDLAAASWEEVSAAWAGLGYYSRARNLHACAQVLAKRLNDGTGFPQTAADWRALPGIGPYTAAAVAAIAFDEPVAPMDGNIERVVSRLWAVESDRSEAGWRAAKKVAAGRAQALFDAAWPKVRAQTAARMRPGDLAQALMDLGAMVCTSTRPNCDICPFAKGCMALSAGDPARYPMKPEKKERPVRYGAAFVLTRRGGEVLLVRRPPKGLLGGMLMPPTSAWRERDVASALDDGLSEAPAATSWSHIGEVRHVFTHFALRLNVYRADADGPATNVEGEWMTIDAAIAASPTVGRKALALALKD